MSKFSVRKPYTVFVAVMIVIMLGVVSFFKMTTDLFPAMSIPYVVVITTYPGASPDKVESTVTSVLEGGLGTVNGVENISSSSNENYSMVMLEFTENTNLDSAMVKLASQLDLISLPDGAGKPMVLEVSMDMLPVLYASVDYDGKDIYELSDFVETKVAPKLERLDGIASVDSVGLVEKTVEIRLNEDKIDELNDRLAIHVDSKLADAKKKLDEARSEFNKAKSQLDGASATLSATQDSTLEELSKASQGEADALANKPVVEKTVAELEEKKTEILGQKKELEEKKAELVDQKAELEKTKGELESQKAELLNTKSAIESSGVLDLYNNANIAFKGIDTIFENPSIAAMAEAMGITRDTFPYSVDDAVAYPEKLAAFITFMNTIGQGDAVAELTYDNLKQLKEAADGYSQVVSGLNEIDKGLAQINEGLPQIIGGISQIDDALDQINTGLEQLDKGINEAKNGSAMINEGIANFGMLEKGKMQALLGFASGSAQIADGKNLLSQNESKLDEAEEAFKKGRDEALKSANLDKVLSIDTLSGLIFAQNFAMPAGYIYQGDSQYLLKVGDEFDVNVTFPEDYFNEELAGKLKQAVLGQFPGAEVIYYPVRGLCAYYVERGGIVAACETD